jgi:YVTN family beta-propeller protein
MKNMSKMAKPVAAVLSAICALGVFAASSAVADNLTGNQTARLPKIVKTITGRPGAYHASVNKITNKIYVVNFFDNTVSVIDGGKDKIIKTIAVGAGPTDSVIDEALGKIYVVNLTDGTISIID